MKDGVINKQGINSRNYISSYNLQRDDEITEKTLAKIKDLLELECTQLLKHIFSLVVLKVLASPSAKVLLPPNAHVGFPAPPRRWRGPRHRRKTADYLHFRVTLRGCRRLLSPCFDGRDYGIVVACTVCGNPRLGRHVHGVGSKVRLEDLEKYNLVNRSNGNRLLLYSDTHPKR